jgi:uncharacterized coiled-coil protein SlyX
MVYASIHAPNGLACSSVEEGRTDRPRDDLDRLTVAQAAEALRISQDAVRKRISRGTIQSDRDESGRVYVYVSASETVHKTDQDIAEDAASKTVQDRYISSLEDQIAFLRRELERKDGILLNLTERIPELEAPSEASASPETLKETPERAEPRPGAGEAQEEQGVQRRSWWRRVFGG